MVGNTLWFNRWFTPCVRIAHPPISRKVIGFSRLKDGTILLHLKDGSIPLGLINDCAYRTREAAEEAMKGDKDV